MKDFSFLFVKLIYSEKATKLDEITLFYITQELLILVVLALPSNIKKRGWFHQIFVAFSENLNLRINVVMDFECTSSV